MSSSETITHWIGQLKGGDPEAARKLWERYFRKLVGLARKKLRGSRRRVADEEDVALSAFDSFFRGVQKGRFPQLNDREDLWGLLIVITGRKAADLVQHERRKKRGGGAVQGESGFLGKSQSSEEGAGIDHMISPEPTPESVAKVADQVRYLLGRLEDVELQQVAQWKLEGYTNEEIASKLGCVPRTVERKLGAIRAIWEQEGGRS